MSAPQMVTVCEYCAAELVGPVATMLHYDNPAGGSTPCQKRLARLEAEGVRSLAARRERNTR